MTPRFQRFILDSRTGKIFLALLTVVYLGYLVAFGRFLNFPALTLTGTVIDHPMSTNPDAEIRYWTPEKMRNAVSADEQDSNSADFTQQDGDSQVQAAKQQEGQPPADSSLQFPLSTVGKLFLTNAYGQNMVCSGTAVVSSNHSVVDTAGHCLYWNKEWMDNVIFCPLYNNGDTPFGCWAARDLEIPSDWLNARPNDFHHDFGIAIVASNDRGSLTDVVGGVGWAYNQSTNQPFYAYGYPAAYPFNGQTRQSCEDRSGKSWQHGGGTVISIPCDMTGGSSGGPWFIQSGNNWYVDGHNDFISSLQPKHMFSPYYDNTWYALYEKAQSA